MDFKEAIRQREQEIRENEGAHQQINAIILRELPVLFETAVGHFKKFVNDTPIKVENTARTKQLSWANGNEYIGPLEVNDYKFSLANRTMAIILNPIVGYVGATAKIEISTSVLRGLPINKGGLFIDVAYRTDERNAVKYMDLNNRVHEFDSNVAEQILTSVFLD
jgi:hypothetical protein